MRSIEQGYSELYKISWKVVQCTVAPLYMDSKLNSSQIFGNYCVWCNCWCQDKCSVLTEAGGGSQGKATSTS